MVLALISYSSTSRLMKTCDVAKLICNTRNLSWQKYSHDRVITKITKANQPHAYVPSRHLGWLLAPKLKPHQKGYDRQQKMYFRSKVLFVIFSWMVLYYGYINGYILETIGILPEDDINNYYENQRLKSEQLLEKKRLQDEEMLRLTEIRKKNVEKYFESKSN